MHKVEGPIAIATDNKSFLNLAGLSYARKVALPCFVFKLFPLNEAVPHKTCTPAQMPHLFYWKIIQCLASHFGVKDQLDRMFDLKIYLVHCDLNVMVQWFLDMTVCDISSYDCPFDFKIKGYHCGLCFMMK